MAPRVSVIVPVYNGAAFVGDCLSSLLRQSRPAHEIIVVDDGSTDGTSEVVRRYGVVLHTRKRNEGAASARAYGSGKSSGDIIAFLDADCMAPSDWIQTIVKEFASDPSLGGVGGRYTHSRPATAVALMAKLEEEYVHSIFFSNPLKANPPGGNSAFLKKVWESARSGLEIHLFRGLASGEDNFVCDEIRKHAKIKFTDALHVAHQPLNKKGYFRRHFNRGRSKALSYFKKLGTKDDLTLLAYGGYSLFASSIALGLAALALCLTPFYPVVFGVSAAAALLLHVFLARRFFGFVEKTSRKLSPDQRITVNERIKLRGILVARSACWIAGAVRFTLERIRVRVSTWWNVVASVLHFWRPGRISKLFYFVTSACNARCEFCFNLENVINWKSRKAVELSLDEMKKIAGNFGRLPYISISGGEPFMRLELVDIIQSFYTLCRTQWVTIPTNGSLTKTTLNMAQEILSRCPRLFLTIQVSLDSMHEEHDKSRKVEGCFEALTETLSRIKPLRKLYPNLRIQIATCYDDFNVGRISEIISYCRDNFDYDQQIFYLIRGAGTITQSNNHLIPSFLQTLTGNEEREWTHHRKTLWSRAVRAFQAITYSDVVKIKEKNEFIRPCHATQKFVTLYDDGQISPCEVLDTVNLGNIRDFEYDFYKLIGQKKAKNFYKKEIVEKKCNCDWMCAIPINMLYDPQTFPRLMKAIVKPGQAVEPL